MSYLFGSPRSGWRYEPSRRQESRKKTVADLREKISWLENFFGPLDEKKAKTRQTLQTLLNNNYRNATKKSAKRKNFKLRRSNPKSLDHVANCMTDLCLSIAKERKLDETKEYWFLKAEMASMLKVPEHYIEQVVHKWNLAGICTQGTNEGMHDTHRDKSWGGPWVSSWQDTRYTLKLDKLLKHK